VLGFTPPASARTFPAWWENEKQGSHVHALAWLNTGWRTSEVSIADERLIVRRMSDAA
jgi:hypothetical protein